jgi:hypothetical protein
MAPNENGPRASRKPGTALQCARERTCHHPLPDRIERAESLCCVTRRREIARRRIAELERQRRLSHSFWRWLTGGGAR